MSVKSEQLPITSPCPITLDREGTTPEDRRMHCAHCVKDVHLLSNMDEREARTFIAAMAGQDICVSYSIRPDGQIRFRDTPSAPAASSLPASPKRAPSSAPALVPVSALTRGRRARSFQAAGQQQVRASSPGGMLAGLGAAMVLAACAPHSNTGAIETQEQVSAPYQDGVIIPVQEPCDGLELQVEGGIKAEPLPQDVQVDGGIQAVPLPKEIQVAGGMRAEPVDLDPFELPEETPEAVEPPAEPQPGADVVEVHTPPAGSETEVQPEPKQHLRGRIAPRHLDPDLG